MWNLKNLAVFGMVGVASGGVGKTLAIAIAAEGGRQAMNESKKNILSSKAWEILGTPGVNDRPAVVDKGLRTFALAVDADGHPAVAWMDPESKDVQHYRETAIFVRHWDGTVWQDLMGATRELPPTGTAKSGNPELRVDGEGNILLAWTSLEPGNWVIFLRRWNNRLWEPLGPSAADWGISANKLYAANFPSMAIDDKGRVLTAYSLLHGALSEIYVNRYDSHSHTWPYVGIRERTFVGVSGQGLHALTQPSMALDRQYRPWVAAIDSLGSPRIRVYRCARKWLRQEWQEIPGLSQLSPTEDFKYADSAPALATDAEGRAWVAWTMTDNSGPGTYKGKSRVYVRGLSEGAWADLAGSGSGDGVSVGVQSAERPSLVLDAQGRPIVAWQSHDGGHWRILLRRWTGQAWEALPGPQSENGPAADAEDAMEPRLAIKDSVLYLAWNQNGSIQVRRRTLN